MRAIVVTPRTRAFSSRRSKHAGTSLVEVVVSTLLTSLVVVGAINGMALIHRNDLGAEIQQQLRYQAGVLLEEIVDLGYADPDSSPSSPLPLGRDDGESPTDRSTWDDIDDAHEWSSDPLTYRDGATKIAFPHHLKAKVTVRWVKPDSLEVAQEETGLKEIRVVVASNDRASVSGHATAYISNSSLTASPNSGTEVTVTDNSGKILRFFVNPVNGASLPENFSL